MTKGNKFEFKNYEMEKATRAFLWSFASLVVIFLIALVDNVEMPPYLLAYLPMISMLLQAIKQFIVDNTAK